ncbi:uncharacterized protein LOC135438215 [Drosophila montana]|uniref:uncharacterized protein LOC135438215 n=1 Tax=Drosophila montana TaxID=40370 RepID=UPI00313AB0EB
MLTTRTSRHTSLGNPKARLTRNARQPCFTLKRPLVFQVRKSLVEYVDDELLAMDTSVFYQRIFILAKNVDPKRESLLPPAALESRGSTDTVRSAIDADTATLRTAEAIMADDEQHYSQQTTPDGSEAKEPPDQQAERLTVKIIDPLDPDVETVTRTFRFDEEDEAQIEAEVEEHAPEPEGPEQPKDRFTLFSEMLRELHKKCRNLSYTPDPMCGLVIYMNEYTMMMLESGEDMMGIFCRELLDCVHEYWQSNRVFLIEDHIKELYTKELLFRRIPAAFLNEKFPPSTPTDEYLMGKQHLIIKDKLTTICTLISEIMDPRRTTDVTAQGSTLLTDMSVATDISEMDGGESDEEPSMHPSRSSRSSRSLNQEQRLTVTISETLPAEIFRKLLPEIQRIELVLSSTRFYYTLEEFCALYGKVPFARDEDGLFWPIQNNYAPPNIFRRTPFDINLTFADYAAEMNRRLQEEQEQNKAELEAAAAAEASAAAQSEPQARPKHKEEEPND